MPLTPHSSYEVVVFIKHGVKHKLGVHPMLMSLGRIMAFILSSLVFNIWSCCNCKLWHFVGLNGGLAGLALTSSIGLLRTFQWGIRESVETENQMTSVERVLEYSELPTEAALETRPDLEPSSNWPQSGTILCDMVNLRYNPESPLVLKDLKFHIYSKEKVSRATLSMG